MCPAHHPICQQLIQHVSGPPWLRDFLSFLLHAQDGKRGALLQNESIVGIVIVHVYVRVHNWCACTQWPSFVLHRRNQRHPHAHQSLMHSMQLNIRIKVPTETRMIRWKLCICACVLSWSLCVGSCASCKCAYVHASVLLERVVQWSTSWELGLCVCVCVCVSNKFIFTSANGGMRNLLSTTFLQIAG